MLFLRISQNLFKMTIKQKIILIAIISAMFLVWFSLFGCKHDHQKKYPNDIHNALSFGIPSIPDSFRLALSRYQNTRGTELEDFSPGNRGVIVQKREEQISRLFLAEKPGAKLKQLTFGNESVFNALVCPDSFQKCLLFEQDTGGNENFQIFSLDLASLKVTQITNNAFQNEGVVWSNKGDRFAFVSNRGNGKDYDLYISSIADPTKATCVLAKGGSWSICDWAPDDRKLLVSQYVSRTSSYLYILDLQSGVLLPLHENIDTASEEIGAFGPEGKGVFFTSDKETDCRCLRYFDCSSKKETLLTPTIHWDVGEIALSKNRERLSFSMNEDGFTSIYLMNTKTYTFKPVPNMPFGIINRLRFSASGAALAMSIKTPRQPECIYAIDLQDFSLTQWASGELGGLEQERMIAPTIIHYPTFDSVSGKPRLIPCFYFKPVNLFSPRPVLIMIHGGPETQFWPAFSASMQFYVNEMGIAVLAPNVRGSGGYGKAYLNLDNGMKREDAVRDIGALLDWIAKEPGLDASRVSVMGGSYGGYMALASMTHFNDRLRAGIDIYGISSFLTFMEHTAPYRKDLRRVEYGDERDPSMHDFLRRISPITSASRITKPLLIVQGANDARVPQEESRQIAAAVQKNGGVVWLSITASEGHGFRRKANIDNQELMEAYFLKLFLVDK
jgi:dipeptidyl aminopeptidase/acylaminoacyl peptidase